MHIIYPILGKWHYNIVFKNTLIFFFLEPIVELEKKLCQVLNSIFAGPG